MKRIVMIAAATATLLGGVAVAEEETGPWSISGSVAVTTNYLFRGLPQSNNDPALQAGVTVAHESGFYAGFWGSSIDFGDGESELELDPFIGYGGSLGENTTFDVNLTYFGYPGSWSGAEYDFIEIGAGIAHDFGPVAVGVKAAWSPDGFGSEGDTFWLGGSLSVPLGDWLSVSGNIGYQWYEFAEDYMHYDIGLTATYENVSFDLRYVGTDYDWLDEEVVFTVGFAF